MKEKYTAHELLAIRGSLNYLLFLISISTVAITLQIISGVEAKNFIMLIVMTVILSAVGYYIYSERKKLNDPIISCWIAAFISITAPILTKYSYAKTMDWTFAVTAYNASISSLTYLLIIQFLQKKKLFLFFSVFFFVNWILFLFIAWKNGAIIHFSSADLLGSIHKDGLFLLREIMFIMVSLVLAYSGYRNIGVLHKYNDDTILQNKIIEDYSVNLEKKVEARTVELQAAMEELEAMNDQLITTRDQLWGEMELAKKIQTVLLPALPQIDGYEISACMLPATEVGGDYYDVINVEGKNWIVIGDVSGHGVPAGLIMMMVQTSIQIALNQNPNIPTTKLLSSINKVISGNICRLKEDKYMTITVLACFEHGVFHFAGLHQDLMIYRAATKKVDIVETDGVWIGLMENIDGMLDDSSIKINKGDTLLLYTDGITEAWEKGSIQDKRTSDAMFGSERLLDVFEKNGEATTNEIKDAIFKSMDNYQQNDDITLVVIKRNCD